MLNSQCSILDVRLPYIFWTTTEKSYITYILCYRPYEIDFMNPNLLCEDSLGLSTIINYLINWVGLERNRRHKSLLKHKESSQPFKEIKEKQNIQLYPYSSQCFVYGSEWMCNWNLVFINRSLLMCWSFCWFSFRLFHALAAERHFSKFGFGDCMLMYLLIHQGWPS